MRPGRWRPLAILLVVVPTIASGAPAFSDTQVTADNSSEDTEAESGSASASNSSSAFVGQSSSGDTTVGTEDASAGEADNIQDGDNEFEATQTITIQTGGGVGGQVIGGVVQDGDLTIDATNASDGVDVQTGDGDGSNEVAAFVGLVVSDSTEVTVDEVTAGVAENVQDGDNQANAAQAIDASSGDGVAGQVIAASVTNGTTDITASNTARDSDVASGVVDQNNSDALFAGLNVSESTTTVSVSEPVDSIFDFALN